MLAYQNQDIKILENSFLAIPIEMAENTLCFQFKLLSLPRPPFLVGYGTDGLRLVGASRTVRSSPSIL